MNIGRLRCGFRRQRIGHRGEIAVIGVADPARAWQISAEVARRHAAGHRIVGRIDNVGIETSARRQKALLVELRVARRAGTKTMILERRLMTIDEGHDVGISGAQCAARTQSEIFDLRQEFVLHKTRCRCEAPRVGIERWMNVETGEAAGAGSAVCKGRIAVGHEHHARQIAADQRPQAIAQLPEALRQIARHPRA